MWLSHINSLPHLLNLDFNTHFYNLQFPFFHYISLPNKYDYDYKENCRSVNALTQATSISTHIIHRRCTMKNVSMPLLRLLPFLRLLGITLISGENMCQCPYSGYFHFYGTLLEPLILAGSQPHFCM